MEHQKNPINNNPNNNNQAENSASTSNTNPAVSEQEKEVKKAEFKTKYTEILKRRNKNEIGPALCEFYVDELVNNFKSFLSKKEMEEIIIKVNKETFDLSSRSEDESDSEEGSSSENEKVFQEEAIDQEATEQQAESSNSTENQEQPTELSEAGKEVISLVDSVILSSEPSGSGEKVEDIFSSEFSTEFSTILHSFTGESNIKNALYLMSEKEREEFGKKLAGLDKIIYDGLLKRVGTRQLSIKSQILTFPLFQIPVLGPSLSNSIIDDLSIELEKSFSITEVKEIVRESRERDFQQLEQIKNFVINMEKDNKDFAESKEKEIKELTESKDRIIIDLKQEKENEKAELEGKLAEANSKGNNLLEELKTVSKQAAEKEQAEKAKIAKENELLEKNTKLLQSKEKVELTEIKQKYEAELAKAQNQEQEIEAKNQALSDYIRLVNQQELKIEILKQEWVISNSERKELSIRETRLEAEKLAKKVEIARLEVEYNSEKRQRANDIDSKNREIARTIAEKNGEIKQIELNHKHQIEQRELKLRQWEQWEINRAGLVEKAEIEREQYRLDFLKIQTERDDLLKTVSPTWLRTAFGRIDWVFGTQLETNGPQFWGKTVFWTKLVLFTLFFALSLYIVSWIIRIFAAVWRNCKAAFAKKQDTASVLKDLFSGIKEAKESFKKRKKTPPIEEQEEEEEEEIFEVEPKPVKNFSRLNSQKKTAKSKGKSKSKTK